MRVPGMPGMPGINQVAPRDHENREIPRRVAGNITGIACITGTKGVLMAKIEARDEGERRLESVRCEARLIAPVAGRCTWTAHR